MPRVDRRPTTSVSPTEVYLLSPTSTLYNYDTKREKERGGEKEREKQKEGGGGGAGTEIRETQSKEEREGGRQIDRQTET